MPSINILDLQKAGDSDVMRPIIELNVGKFPELLYFPAESLGAGKFGYKTLKRIGYPTAAFHDLGAGVASSKSITKLETFETFSISSRVECPKQTADDWPRGGAAGYFAFESAGIAAASMFQIAKQTWYGRGGNSNKGFPGIKNFCAFATTVTDPLSGKVYNMVVNAAGTTANTASSAYLVKFSGDPTTQPDGIQYEFGGKSPFELPDPRIGDMTDPQNAALRIEAYIAVMTARAGLQIPSEHCVRRIANLTDDAGKGMTDALLGKAMAEFPQGYRPDRIFMSTHQRYLLQLSRTVVLQGQGTDRPNQPNIAPVPTEYDGIPISATDAIGDTDAIETTAAAEE